MMIHVNVSSKLIKEMFDIITIVFSLGTLSIRTLRFTQRESIINWR